jgi:hypothetical protein
MMGSRGLKGAREIDALSRKTRRVLILKPTVIRKAKRTFNKRTRHEARLAAESAAYSRRADH